MKSSVSVMLFMLFIASHFAEAHARELLVDLGSKANVSEVVFGSINEAMKRFGPGDVLTISNGVYYEPIILPKRNWSKDKPAVIKPQESGKVLISALRIVDKFDNIDGGLLRKKWDVNCQQVLVDGKLLMQIGGDVFGGFPTVSNHPLHRILPQLGGVWPGRISGDMKTMPVDSFYYDRDSSELYVRLKDGAHFNTIEASYDPFLLYGENVKGLTVKGLSFKGGNTSDKSRQGVVALVNSNFNTLENLNVYLADGVGISFKGDNNVISNCVVKKAGRIGISAKGNRNALLNNITIECNYRGFNKFWEAGGCKFIGDGGLRNSTLDGQISLYNNGDGIWYDYKNANNVIRNVISAYNNGHGIHYEASYGADISNSFVYRNEGRGIYFPNSSDCSVFNSTVLYNKLGGVVAASFGRKDENNEVFKVESIHIWNCTIGNNDVNINDGDLVIPGKESNTTSNNNIYISSRDNPVFSNGFFKYTGGRKMFGLDEWQNSTGHDLNSTYVKSTKYFDFIKPDISNKWDFWFE